MTAKKTVRKLSWFGVKTLYRSRATGRPTSRLWLQADAALLEERVVLFRARSFADALSKAEREAVRYSADTHTNPYGQIVSTKYLGVADAYALYDDPASGVEVFSATELISTKETIPSLIVRKFGRVERSRRPRYAFLNADFNSGLTELLASRGARESAAANRVRKKSTAPRVKAAQSR